MIMQRLKPDARVVASLHNRLNHLIHTHRYLYLDQNFVELDREISLMASADEGKGSFERNRFLLHKFSQSKAT